VVTTTESPSRVRFDGFEVDLRSGEVWKDGTPLRLQGQPYQVLCLLLERRGEIVTREELKQRLWPGHTFVDFDDGLNTAVKKIRDLLGDSAERPRYIETIPRRGYRFMAAVEPRRAAALDTQPAALGPPIPPPEAVAGRHATRRRWFAVGLVLAVATLAFSAWIYRFTSRGDAASVRAIAVLPLKNLSGDPAQDYFAAGLTDALTTELARTAGSSLRVISRTSADKYKDKPLEEIARELDVDAVIEGSVIRSGNRARITAQLINARADKHLWAASYDRDLHDLLGLHREIAATVARQVQITISPGAQARLASVVAVDPQAYDLYQRGRYIAFSNNRQEIAAAIGFLEQAVALEPNLAAAHALLARTYSTRAFLVEPQQQDLDAKAMEEVDKALKLDPDLADAYLARGILYWTHRNGFAHERAILEIKRALELNPSSAEAHHELGAILNHIGLLDGAEQELRTALRLEPTNVGVRYRIGVNLLIAGKAREGMAALEGTRAFFPENWSYHMALALFELDRKPEAALLIRDFLRDNPRDEGGVGNAMQALLHADAGQAALAERSIQAAIQKGKDFGHFHHAAYTIGTAYALMNRPQDAVRWLRAAADDGFPCYPLYERDHSLDNLRANEKFMQLMRDLKGRWEHYRAIS
jgi:TolB-like protein/DNA-binding winged helix-turn-helix (wHTH) protein/Tfp pilus assembly protein PilF